MSTVFGDSLKKSGCGFFNIFRLSNVLCSCEKTKIAFIGSNCTKGIV